MADIKFGIAGRGGAFAALVLGAVIPALLPKGALEAIGGQLDSERKIATIRNPGRTFPWE